VYLAIPPVKDESDTGVFLHDRIDAFEPGSDVLEGEWLAQGEIKVF
jgi:hypothetical protein